ncbi:hypothetical protein HOLleu_39286 [Holothuria leucospilota]|uniref:Uncharacterized protein n=1 Tax=Holothuria leucospilota TaxID=206669 RepID=A0A9Q0YI63_HOLLE|nr:hypothetical protein HOLleu_39286 [Holothuria leucospilota]
MIPRFQHDVIRSRWKQPAHPTPRNQLPMRQEYFQVSDSLKILFVHIPLTGGIAIESSHLFEDQQKKLGGGHHIISAVTDPAFQNYHKFGMVRHPCSRVISLWQYFLNYMGNKEKKAWVTTCFNETTLSSFDAFVDLLFTRGVALTENECHLQSQVGMIFSEDERFGLDQLLVYERWDESLKNLGERIKVDKNTFKTIEKPVVDRFVCKDKYTPITWSKIRTLYAIDFCVLGYSTDILEENTVPLLKNLTSDINSRYRKCRAQTESKTVDLVYDHHVSKLPGNVQCTMYTYFQKDNNTKPDAVNENNKILHLWERAWSLAGWKPRILTEEDAKRHPNYEEFSRKFWAFPTVNKKEYEIACFMRYLAMAAVGGGWMSDYDVLPFRLSGCIEPLNDGGYTVYEGYFPGLVSGTSQEFTRVAKIMANVDWKAHSQHFSVNNKPHVSDLHCHAKMVGDKLITSINVDILPDDLFDSPFPCNRTTSEMSLDSIPVGLPRMPWAVHYAHRPISILHERNLTHLGDQYFDLKSISRSDFMKIAYNFLQENCL